MPKKSLKKLPKSMVTVFKIKNRRGFAAICLKNLTEGTSASQALERLKNPLRRMGYELN